jgi:hypothetical protein
MCHQQIYIQKFGRKKVNLKGGTVIDGFPNVGLATPLHLNVKLYFNVTSILVSELKYSLMGQTHFYDLKYQRLFPYLLMTIRTKSRYWAP